MPKAYRDRVRDVLANAEKYHRAYYQADTFRGPSLYFHQRALQARQSTNIEAHLEYVYATLATWGMHRMGKGGSKMQSFDAFRRSLEPLKERIADAQRFTPQNM